MRHRLLPAAFGLALALILPSAESGAGIVSTYDQSETSIIYYDDGSSGPGPGMSAAGFNDTYFSEQWALSNDGSFVIRETGNIFPFFEDPFWMMPMMPGLRISITTSAVAGIDIGFSDAYAAYNGGVRDVVVALIDTGVDYAHEDLRGAIWVNEDEIPDNGIDDDQNGYIDDVRGWNFYNNSNQIYAGDEDSHGTHGAGTIAARSSNGIGIAGIAGTDRVKLMSLKALGGRSGSGTTESVIAAIRYAEANGAAICNLSFGSSLDDARVYETIASSSMLFIVAAGNDGTNLDIHPSYPASYDLPNIISVANLNMDGTLHYSSDYGAGSVDIAAPGTYILSTTAGGSYGYMSGTSMAAPVVTGAAALLYTQFGDASPIEIRSIILESARRLQSLTGYVSTGGMLDLAAAMRFDISSLR